LPQGSTGEAHAQGYGAYTVQDGAYTVQEGDTLIEISEQTEVPVDELEAANPHFSDPDMIRPGDVVYVPLPNVSGTSNASVPQQLPEASVSGGGGVADGDRDPESVGGFVLPPIEQRNPLAIAMAFFNGDIQGQHIDFSPGSPMSEIFKKGVGAQYFEDYVLQQFGGRVPGSRITNVPYTFTWPRATQTANSAEQVVGSWQNGSAYIDNNGTIHFSIDNTMSFNSLFFGRQLSEYGYSGVGPLPSDVTMTINWTSP